MWIILLISLLLIWQLKYNIFCSKYILALSYITICSKPNWKPQFHLYLITYYFVSLFYYITALFTLVKIVCRHTSPNSYHTFYTLHLIIFFNLFHIICNVNLSWYVNILRILYILLKFDVIFIKIIKVFH